MVSSVCSPVGLDDRLFRLPPLAKLSTCTRCTLWPSRCTQCTLRCGRLHPVYPAATRSLYSMYYWHFGVYILVFSGRFAAPSVPTLKHSIQRTSVGNVSTSSLHPFSVIHQTCSAFSAPEIARVTVYCPYPWAQLCRYCFSLSTPDIFLV